MLVADALPRLEQVCLNGATHADYTLTVARALLYRRLATGDIAPLMRRMARRESDTDYAARVSMTIETVSSAWNQLRTPFYAVARLRNGVTRRFDYDDAVAAPEATRRAARLEDVLSTYYAGAALQNYLAERLSRVDCLSDPNAWLLTEFAPFDFRTQVARPYPVLIPCEAAVDFSRAAGITQQLTVRLAVAGFPGAYRYLCYLDSEAVDCWPVVWQGQTPHATLPPDSVLAGEFTDPLNGRVLYQYRVLRNAPGRVPAQPAGYVIDEQGTGETYVSPLHAAVPFLLQMLKVGSENDIVMSQMAFPIRLAYVPRCPGRGMVNGTRHSCTNGQDPLSPGGQCEICQGTGTVPVPITAAETLALPIPEPGEELRVKAADLLSFVSPPTDNPRLQLDYLNSRAQLAMQAIFGQSEADRVAGSQTATQRQIELQEKLTALAPFADWFAGAYVYQATVAAAYADVAQGLRVVYEFPPDLEQDTEADLYAVRLAALTAGASAQTLEAIDKKIAYKQFSSDEAALVRSKVRQRFIMFAGYSEDQVLKMWSLGIISAEDRVSRTHADAIFSDLEMQYPAFYTLKYPAQSVLVTEKIAAILAKLPTAPAAGAGVFRPLSFPAPPAPAVPAPVA